MNQPDPVPSGSQTSGLSISSLVLGVLSLICFNLFTGIPAVICGHQAISRIGRSGGRLTGREMAIAGLVTGYLGILWGAIIIPLMVAITIPNFIKARELSQIHLCSKNLHEIEAAKNAWALAGHKNPGEVPSLADLKPYLKDGVFPVCPVGGTYTIGAVGDDPLCSVPGHQLAPGDPLQKLAITSATPTIAPAPAPPATPAPPAVPGLFIPAPFGTDMVHDPKRNVLYIANGRSVLRYQLATRTFLPPLALGGELRGMDISPDHDLLAVADATDYTSDNAGTIGIHLVDLPSGSDLHVKFPAERNEGGTHSVVFDADSTVWITSSRGLGTVPLRKYSPASQRVTVFSRVTRDTMLATSANREHIAFAETGSGIGYYGQLGYQAARLPPQSHANTLLYDIGISRDGSQLAVPVGNGLLLSGTAIPKLEDNSAPLGVAFHPLRDFLFVSRAMASTITVYETTNYTVVKELDFGLRLPGNENQSFQAGHLRVSSDGKYIFCTVSGGVRYAETGL